MAPRFLDYAQPQSPFAWLSMHRRKMLALMAAAAVIALVIYGYVHGPTSAQLRVDTCDVRYLWWGIPLRYERMPEPWRSKLLKLAAAAPATPAKWIPGHIDNPEFGWNRGHRYWYCIVASWADEDPRLGQLLYADMIEDELRGVWMPPASTYFSSAATVFPVFQSPLTGARTRM